MENNWKIATIRQGMDLEKKIEAENADREANGIETLLTIEGDNYPMVKKVGGFNHFLVGTTCKDAGFDKYVVYSESGRLSGYWPS